MVVILCELQLCHSKLTAKKLCKFTPTHIQKSHSTNGAVQKYQQIFAKCIILHFQKSVTSCTICQWCCCSVYQRCYMYVEVSANGAVLHCVLMMSCSTVCSWCCRSVYQSAMCTKGALLLMVLLQCLPKVLC